jgi:hypothetical protein
MGYLVLMVFLVIELGIGVLTIVAWVKVITKAGYSGWWFLISLVPVVNFVMFLVFAFSKWPVQVRLEAAERSNRQSGGQMGPYGLGPYVGAGRAVPGGQPAWGQSSWNAEGPSGPRSWDSLR